MNIVGAIFLYELALILRVDRKKLAGDTCKGAPEEWRKLHNAELHALYSSPNIIRNLKMRRLRWAAHVAHMEQSRNAYF